MALSNQQERLANLTADNILLKGIVAYLMAKALPDAASRIEALKNVLEVLGPELHSHLQDLENRSPQLGQQELQRIRQRGGYLVQLAEKFS